MSSLFIPFLLAALLTACLGRLAFRRRFRGRRIAAGLLFFLALLSLAATGYSFWYYHRPLPEPIVHRSLFQGITYTREILRQPRPMVAHIVRIDLQTPGLEFLVTPPDPVDGRQLRGQTVSQFLQKQGCQIAINAGGFSPWYAHGPFSYYPHTGDGVDPMGPLMSRGQRFPSTQPAYPALSITRDNRATIGDIPANAWNVVSCDPILLKDGRLPPSPLPSFWHIRHPRTAVAVDATGRYLLLVVVDGRQPSYSEGVTLPELAEIILRHGGHTALNLDGGGSSALVIAGADGKPQVLNTPCHGRHPPGVQRPVASHLGIYVPASR